MCISADIIKKAETTGRTRIKFSAEKAHDLIRDLVDHIDQYAKDNEKIGKIIIIIIKMNPWKDPQCGTPTPP